MFKQRLLTLLILIPLVLLGIYYASAWWIDLIAVALLIVAGKEWLQLIPITHSINKIIFMLALLFATWTCHYWFNYWAVMGLSLWGLILVAVVTFPASQKVWGYPWLIGGACLLLLPLFGNSLSLLYHQLQGKDLLVYVLCLVWATDIGAYLIGKLWGRFKLIPHVSPGKTVEGAAGGFLLAMFVAWVGSMYFTPINKMMWFTIAFFTIFIAMLGDLFISMLKRRSKIKDTGQLLPGHGGVLDRLDSLIAALPLFYCALCCLPFKLPSLWH